MAAWIISESDIKSHPHFGTRDLHLLLWDYGMNTYKPWADDGRWLEVGITEHKRTHRSIFTDSIQEHCCPRYVGVARTDGPWKRFVDRFLDLPII